MIDIVRLWKTVRPVPVRRGSTGLFGAGLFGAVMLALALAAPATPVAADDAAPTVAAEAPGAARLNDGIAAWDTGDYDSAAAILKPLADAGDPQAQERMAVLYIRGLGVTQDNAIANHYLHLAADAGNAAAQETLGLRYLYGEGAVRKDELKGVSLLEQAAANGLPKANFALGFHYSPLRHKHNTPEHVDYDKSVSFMEQAAKSDLYRAQHFLGLSLVDEVGGQQLHHGMMWLRVAMLNEPKEFSRTFDVLAASLKKQMPLPKYLTLRTQIELRARRCLESGYEDCG